MASTATATATAAAVSSEILQATDIEGLEVTETDAALLRELLEEWENEEVQKDGVKQIVGALENESNDDDDKLDISKQNEEMNVDSFEYYQAPDMVDSIIMTPNSPSVDETMAWYLDDTIGTGEFDCNIDYSLSYSGVFFEEEATYGCLWQD